MLSATPPYGVLIRTQPAFGQMTIKQSKKLTRYILGLPHKEKQRMIRQLNVWRREGEGKLKLRKSWWSGDIFGTYHGTSTKYYVRDNTLRGLLEKLPEKMLKYGQFGEVFNKR